MLWVVAASGNNGRVAAFAEPAFTSSGPILDWLSGAFVRVPMIVPAGEFGPGLPSWDMPAQYLTGFVIGQGSAERNQIWAGIAVRARQPATRAAYRLIAVQVARPGLLSYRNHIGPRTDSEKADLDADLVHGLLRRPVSIDTGTTNIGGKLITSATGYAKGRWRAHLQRPRPAQPRDDAASEDPGSLQTVLDRWLARLAATGSPLDPADVELIAATRLDGQTIIDAAARLGLPLEAAYKRRQRAEARLRAVIPNRRGRTAERRARGA